MKHFIYLLLFFVSIGFCKAQNGFYGKRLSVAGAVLLNRPSLLPAIKIAKPTLNLGLRYAMGGRGQFAIDYSAGKVDYLRRIYFTTEGLSNYENLFSEVSFPIQQVQSIFIEQRLFRKHSYAPIGSYLGIGIGINKYSMKEGTIEAQMENRINYQIPLEQTVQTNFFINDYYITMGKVIPLGKRLLLDIHLRFNGIYLLDDTYFFGPNNRYNRVELEENELSGNFTIPESQYGLIENRLQMDAKRFQRNLPRLLFSIQYLLY
jgi:hypothetical protein